MAKAIKRPAGEKPAARPRPAPAVAKKKNRVIYMGPSLPNGSLRHGQVFIGNPPAHLPMEKVGGFMIPLNDLPAAKRDLKDPTSLLARKIRDFVDSTGGEK
jgi:hypothetical protein